MNSSPSPPSQDPVALVEALDSVDARLDDRRLAVALTLFDEERYFEFHDVLEELWREEPGVEREFYRGLLQVGVALHKARLGQMGGARKLLDKGRARLSPFVPDHRGLAVGSLVEEIAAWLERAAERDRAGLPAWPDGTPPRISQRP